MKIKKFDLLVGPENHLFIILSDKMDIPYFECHMASNAAFDPLEIQNPEEWKSTFEGYISLNLMTDKYEILNPAHYKYRLFDFTPTEGTIPFDHGTGDLRRILGLIMLSSKCWEQSGKGKFLENHLK